jgi:uncharacterized protein YcbK (DUF882 family)
LRRGLQSAAAAGLLALLGPARALAPRILPADPQFWRRPRMLWVTRPQSQEAVRTVYWADGAVQPEGYAALNRIYRDVHANAQRPIALGLLDLNFLLQSAIHHLLGPRPLILLSGYRTPATNARVGGTVPNIHGLGLADDYRYEGLSLQENYRLARLFQVGGLGLYPDRGSLHKDIGRFRTWVTRGRHGGSPHEHPTFR